MLRSKKNYEKKWGVNFTSPEFLARAEREGFVNLKAYKNLEQQEARSKTQEALKNSEEPASYGETYLREYAKDSEMRKAIDNSYKVRKELFEKDEFISRETEYETTYELA